MENIIPTPIMHPSGTRMGLLINRTAIFHIRRGNKFFCTKDSWALALDTIQQIRGYADVIIMKDKERGEFWSIKYNEFLLFYKEIMTDSGIKMAVNKRDWTHSIMTDDSSQQELFDFVKIIKNELNG